MIGNDLSDNIVGYIEKRNQVKFIRVFYFNFLGDQSKENGI
jgi:hypothetical protein